MKKSLTIAVIAACMTANVNGQCVEPVILSCKNAPSVPRAMWLSAYYTEEGYRTSSPSKSVYKDKDGKEQCYWVVTIDTRYHAPVGKVLEADNFKTTGRTKAPNPNSLLIENGKVTVRKESRLSLNGRDYIENDYYCITEIYTNVYVTGVTVSSESAYTSVNVTFADDFPGTTTLKLEPDEATTAAAATTLKVANVSRVYGTSGSNLKEATIIGGTKKTLIAHYSLPDPTRFTNLETLTVVNTVRVGYDGITTGALPDITKSTNIKTVNVHWDENPPTAAQIKTASPINKDIERTVYLKQSGKNGVPASGFGMPELIGIYDIIKDEWVPNNIDVNMIERGNPDNTGYTPLTGKALSRNVPPVFLPDYLKSMPEGYTLEAYATVDEAGNYKFEYLPGGTYIVMIEKDGYTSQPSAEIEVTGESGSISGLAFVVDHDNRTIGPYVAVGGVSIGEPALSLVVGASETLDATVTPTDATEPAVTWSSNNPAAATVDEATRLVTAVAPGEAVITATAGDHTATCTVTVESESITAAPELYAPDMKAYPNPFTGTVRLTGVEGCTLRVINTAGTTVHTQNIENPDETVRLEHMPAGVYFFHIEKNGKTKTVRVVKQ